MEAELTAFALTIVEEAIDMKLRTYKEAMANKEVHKWKLAMHEEIKSLNKNKNWKLVSKSEKSKLVGSKWIYKRKEGILGIEGLQYKARLVAKGFTQREGIDYNEIFFPVVKHSSIRLLLSYTAYEDLYLEQLDVKTTFLYGELDEVIYMQPQKGLTNEFNRNQMCLLKKSFFIWT